MLPKVKSSGFFALVCFVVFFSSSVASSSVVGSSAAEEEGKHFVRSDATAVTTGRQARTLGVIFRFIDSMVDRFVETFLSSQPQPGLFEGAEAQQAGGNPDRNSGIRSTCRYSEECRRRASNSVCYNGRCLCGLGYHFSEEKDNCVKDVDCPSCKSDKPGGNCHGGMDLFCNGTCVGEGDDKENQGLMRLEVGLEKKQLATPNWPHNYPYNMDQFVCLTATTGRRVNLDFRWMDLETLCGMEDCDYVKVYDGCMADDHTNLLAFFNGDNAHAKECVTSSCSQMLLHFHSDPQKPTKRADSRSGVMGYYKAVQHGVNPCSDVDNNLV